jgi:hypothetical protein
MLISDFCDAYAPLTFDAVRFCDSGVLGVFAAPHLR